MFDFDSLIGLEVGEAKEILAKNGFNDINIVINSKQNDKTDKLIVCATKQSGTFVTLVCGEFYLNIKR